MSHSTQFNRCFVILADGARPDVMQREALAGNLPNISKYLISKGCNETMIGCFPSTTGPAYMPFLTGCFPGTCNVPGIRWFDKDHYHKKGWSHGSFRSYVGIETYLMNYDMDRKVRNSYQIFERPISIFNMIHRGIPSKYNLTSHSRMWYYYYGHITDRWSFVDQAAIKKLIKGFELNPDFAFVVFPAIDEYSHRSSPFHPRTIQAYHELDIYIGQLAQALKQKGWLDDTLIMIVADHGLSDTKEHFDIGPYLEEVKGLKTLFYTQVFKRNIDASVMISGNGMAHLYFKGPNGWKGRLPMEEMAKESLLLDELRLREEIDLVVCTSADNSIHLMTEKGHGHYKIDQNIITYRWTHAEPLNLTLTSEEEAAQCITMNLDSSYRRTFNTHYPDVFVQMEQVFRSPRCGDVIVSAKPGYDLRKRYEVPEHKASHGSLCPEHMKIPFVMNYPLQKTEDQKVLRSIDVFPTYLKLLNKPIPEGIDGISLV